MRVDNGRLAGKSSRIGASAAAEVEQRTIRLQLLPQLARRGRPGLPEIVVKPLQIGRLGAQRLVGADHVCELSPPALGDRSRFRQVLRIEPEQRQRLEQLP